MKTIADSSCEQEVFDHHMNQPTHGLSASTPTSTNDSAAFFTMMFQQNCENARHIKNERIWFMNIFSIITAGVLSLLHGIRGEVLLECSLIMFMCVFSLIGLLTSFRLKAELEECLDSLRRMAIAEHLETYLAVGESSGALTRYPKFRWVFPVFYSLATAAFFGLLIYRLVVGRPVGFSL
jgi:hypothetical protein